MNKDLPSMSLEVKQDPNSDDLYLELPQDLLDKLGWQINDVLIWEKVNDNAWSVRKKS